jgi:GNAT superfamily N-acetyltransferase
MDLRLSEEPISALAELAGVPIAFTVDRVLDVVETDGTPTLRERALPSSYLKDYDALAGEGPGQWARRFDVAPWGLIMAHMGGLVGGAVIACRTPELALLEGRTDLALLWDIRVAPAWRGRGIGSALFRAAEEWATVREYRQLKVETQNINLAACRFYARQGCVLGEVDPRAYPGLPDETQLLWYKDLAPPRDPLNGSSFRR